MHLITMADGYHEVIDELERMGLYNDVDVYLFAVMNMLELEDIAMTKDIPPNIRLSDTMLIPKRYIIVGLAIILYQIRIRNGWKAGRNFARIMKS